MRVTRAAPLLQLVDVAHQGELVQERGQSVGGGALAGDGPLEILGGGDELVEVLQPRLGLGRAFLP